MAVGLGVGDTAVEQPAIHLRVALEPQPRGEEALPDQAHLVLDLPLLPAAGWRAGGRLDEIMPVHLRGKRRL